MHKDKFIHGYLDGYMRMLLNLWYHVYGIHIITIIIFVFNSTDWQTYGAKL